MRQLALIAYRNLLQHGRRSLILGGAIAAVTALLVLLTCLSSGVKATMLESATTVATGHINVGGYYKITAGQAAPLVTDYKAIEKIVLATLPDVTLVTARGRGWSRLVSDEGSMQVGMASVDLANEPRLPKVLKMKEGKLADLAKPGSVLIFASQAKKLKVKTGDSMVFSVLTERGVNNTVDVKVIGVAEDMGLMTSWNVFVPDVTLRQLYQLNDRSTGAVQIFVKDMSKIEKDIDLLRGALTKAGYPVMERDSKAFWMKLQQVTREDWTGQKLDLTDWKDEISFVIYVLNAIDGISVLLTTVLLVIIAIGIMNTLWIAIRERTREIGTLRAIGMQRWRVLVMFVIESFLLGAMGTTVGVALGVGFSLFLNTLHLAVPPGAQFLLMSSVLKLGFEGGRIFGAAFVITLCCTLISVIPSFKAARLKPVTAMSHI
jgi:ABC-type lipoprotein release transport system permease subunit